MTEIGACKQGCGGVAVVRTYGACRTRVKRSIARLLIAAVGSGLLVTPAGAQPDAGSIVRDASAPALSARADAGLLRREIGALERVVDGRLPDGWSVAALFEVDLQDERAVAQRRVALGVIIRAAKQRLVSRLAELGLRPVHGDQELGPPSPVPTSSVATSSITAPVFLQLIEPDSRGSVELEGLKITRDELRAAFLARPVAARTGLLQADRDRQRIEAEAAAAKAALDEAAASAAEAEQARQVALSDALQARTVAERTLASERARVEGARAALANQRAALAQAREVASAAHARAAEQLRSLAQRGGSPELTPSMADALYEEVYAAEHASLDAGHQGIGAVAAVTAVEAFSSQLDLDDPAYAELGEARDRLGATIEHARAEADRLRGEERADRLRVASNVMEHLDRVNELRTGLIDRLTPEHRRLILGFSKEGFDTLALELEYISVLARWYPRRRILGFEDLAAQGSKLVFIGVAGVRTLELILLVLVLAFVLRRRDRWFDRLERWLEGSRNRSMAQVAGRWLRFLRAVAFEAGMLLGAYGVTDLLGLSGEVELELLRILALSYAWYRLVIAAAHHVLAHAAMPGRGQIPAEMSVRIMRSIRLVGRYALAIIVIVTVSPRVLGRGYLYHLAIDFAWLGAVPIAFVLIGRWRQDIADAYLASYPEGRLAQAVRNTSERPVGFFIVVVSFAVVFAHGATRYASTTLMQLDQTRRALAFLFRRRLEKQAATVGYGRTDPADFTPAIVEALTEAPATGDLTLDHFPELSSVAELLGRWSSGGLGRPVALVGERGIGKTTWLTRLQDSLPRLDVMRLDLERRLHDESDLAGYLSSAFELGEMSSVREFVRARNEGPKRVVLLDQGQNLVLRAMGGMVAYEAFMNVLMLTAPSTFWVVSFSRYAWRHIETLYAKRNVYGTEVRLEGWTEERIGDLLTTRMRAAGVRAAYHDLVPPDVQPAERTAELARTTQRYHRLLWDYAGGNPRVALHFWLRSLVPDGDEKVRVRLFAAPEADDLELLEDESRFILASLTAHENLTLEEVARATGYVAGACEATLAFLRASGIVELGDGRYRITSHYNRATQAFLHRKHLLQG